MMNIKSQLSCAFAFLPWFYQHCFAQNLQYFILSASFPKNYTTNTYHNEFPKSHLQIPWQSNSICRSYAKASFRCGQKCFSNWRRHSYRYSYGRGICQSKSRPHLLNWKKTQPSYRSRRKSLLLNIVHLQVMHLTYIIALENLPPNKIPCHSNWYYEGKWS